MQINEEINVTVEKISNLGFGIAHHDGMVVFIENACPEDELKVKITKVSKTYANAEIVEITKPSPHRVEPFCAMQKVCGACQLQFIDYDYQLKLKKEIVEDTLHSIGGFDFEVKDPIASPMIKEYRCKVQYPIGQTKVSKRILAGYYKPKSHEIVNIKHCPIQPEICDKIIDFIREKALECFKRSGELGCAAGFYNLGFSYFNGLGTSVDCDKALYYLDKAGQMGESDGFTGAGIVCLHRKDGKKNPIQACDYFCEALNRNPNDATAIFKLGELYAYGIVAKKDKEMAKKLFERSAELGDEDAKQALIDLKNGKFD